MASVEEETALQLLLTTDALRASEELVASLRDEIARLKASGFEHTGLSIDDGGLGKEDMMDEDDAETPEQTRTRTRTRTRSRSRRKGGRNDDGSAARSSASAVSASTASQKSRETLQKLEEFLGKRSKAASTTVGKGSGGKKRRRTVSASNVSEDGSGSSVKKGRSQTGTQTKVIRRTGRVEGLSTCVTLNGVEEQIQRKKRGGGSKKKKAR